MTNAWCEDSYRLSDSCVYGNGMRRWRKKCSLGTTTQQLGSLEGFIILPRSLNHQSVNINDIVNPL